MGTFFLFLERINISPQINNLVERSSYSIPSNKYSYFINYHNQLFHLIHPQLKYPIINKEKPSVNLTQWELDPIEYRKLQTLFPHISFGQLLEEGTLIKRNIPLYEFIPPLPTQETWVAYLCQTQEDKIIGYVQGRQQEIREVEISLNQRRKGYCKELMIHVFNYLLEKYPIIFLTTFHEIPRKCYYHAANHLNLLVKENNGIFFFSKSLKNLSLNW